MDNQKLVRAIRAGDQAVILQIYREAFPSCRRFIIQNNGTQSDAEDLFQEAMIILYKKTEKPDFQLKSGVKTFLYAVVRNLWLAMLRKDKKSGLELRLDDPDSSLEILEEADFSIQIDDEEDLSEKETTRFRQAFEQLNKECQELLMDVYIGRIPLKELEKEKGFAKGYMKLKASRCRDRLRNLFLSKGE